MPALYAIAQHPALAAVHAQLREGEAVFAYLDDIYVVAVQGLLVLGTPLGTDEYVHGVLAAKRAEHERPRPGPTTSCGTLALSEEPQLDTTRGWQRPASRAVDEFCFRSILR